MSLETLQARYPVYLNEQFQRLNLREIVTVRKETEPKPFVWSARLSTGIFGLPDCPAGDSPHVPRGEDEVLLALGDKGLEMLFNLGFLPCPACHPENTPDFWEKSKGAIGYVYPWLTDVHQIMDHDLVPFDARGLCWELLRPIMKSMPNRLYILPGLDKSTEGKAEVTKFRERIIGLGFTPPPIGYYVNEPPWFIEYALK
jgi:hypothetical protein